MGSLKEILERLFKKSSGIETTEDKARKKALTIFLIFAVIFFFIFFITGGTGSKKTPKQQAQKGTVVESPLEKIDISKEEWTLKSASRIVALEEASTKHEQDIYALKERVDSINTRLDRTEKNLEEIRKLLGEVKDLMLNQPAPSYAQPQIQQPQMQQPQVQQPVPQTQEYAPQPQRKIRVSSPSSSVKDTAKVTATGIPISPESTKTGEIVLPAGSFMRVRFLSGVFAPCNDVEIPVLMEVVSPSITPRDRKNFVGSFIIGSAIGDYSSKRALVRLETFALLYKDTVLTIPAKGWIVSAKDGKYGIGGRIYDRSGKYIAYAISSAFLQGVGSAVASKFVSTTTNPLGGTTVVVNLQTTQDMLKYAGALGLTSTANTLSQYFMQKANQVVPVVELPAGTIADIVLLEDLRI